VDGDSSSVAHEVIDLDTSHDEPSSSRRRRSSSSGSSHEIEPSIRPITSSNKRKKPGSDDIDEEKDEKEDLTRSILQNDAEVCPICLEEWTNSGQHRLVATECGHLFGKMSVSLPLYTSDILGNL
jgi:hypothetical protein